MEPYGPWMVTSDDGSVKRFPKTLAGARSMVRAYTRRGITVTVYEQTRVVPGLGPLYYPYREGDGSVFTGARVGTGMTYVLIYEQFVSTPPGSFTGSKWEQKCEVYTSEREAQAEATRLRAKPGTCKNVRVIGGKELSPKP